MPATAVGSDVIDFTNFNINKCLLFCCLYKFKYKGHVTDVMDFSLITKNSDDDVQLIVLWSAITPYIIFFSMRSKLVVILLDFT